MHLRSSLALAVVVAGWATSARAQSFEGVVVAQMFANGVATHDLTTSYKGRKARIDYSTAGPLAGAYMVMDGETGTMISVMPSRKMYMTVDLKSASKESMDGKPIVPPTITATGRSETIAGKTCEHYTISRPNHPTMDVCAAKGMGIYHAASGPGKTNTDLGIDFQVLLAKYKDGFQPLKVERVTGTERQTVLLVKSIEPKRLDAALFEVPAGYGKFDASAMTKGRKPPR